ncbi:MAG: GNAT family N-acetyltransferase [Phycisphaerales bacterium]|nr:MAG: GNAT family N-acetyltransferase [Phycisphaerales bacterium]
MSIATSQVTLSARLQSILRRARRRALRERWFVGGAGSDLTIRKISASSHDYLRAMHLVLDLDWEPPDEPAQQVTEMLASADRHACPVDLVYGAYRGTQLISAAIAVESPGSAALILVPTTGGVEAVTEATAEALCQVTEAAWSRSIRLLQILVDPAGVSVSTILPRAGFRYLTRLVYLTRGDGPPRAIVRPTRDLIWLDYAPDREPLFHQALEATYAQSLDCPELNGVRSTAEVLASHRASGVFDPALWWVTLRGDAPAGVLLLNPIPGRSALELVYMGASHDVRGTGVGDALIDRAVRAMREIGATSLSLAVDHRNFPAKQLYNRWDFRQFMDRDAWIANLRPARG